MKGKRILIIEDDSDLSTALQESLTNRGFVAEVAGTGEKGLEMVKENPPDLILLDFILPGINGVGVLEALKPIRDEKKIPIIALSNIDNPEDLKKVREYEVEEYLIKTDWRLEDIVAKIKSAIK